MARRGENIRKRSDGRWEGRYLIYINGSKKYRSVYASSYNEVKQKLFNSKKESEITLLSQKEQTAPLNGSADMSLDEIGQLWLSILRIIASIPPTENMPTSMTCISGILLAV